MLDVRLKDMERPAVIEALREAAAALGANSTDPEEEGIGYSARFLLELAAYEERDDRILTFHLPQTLDLVAKVTMAVAKDFPDGTLDGRGPDESALIVAPRVGAAAEPES